MPKKGGFVEPLIFMVVLGTVSGLIQAVLSLLHLSVTVGVTAALMSLVIMPVATLIGGFIGAAIAFVIWKLMGSQEDYETAYRCCAYISAVSPITTVLGVIPYLGSVLAVLIGTYYTVMASIETHKIPPKKAWTVFGIIAAVLILFSLSAQFAARRMAGETSKFRQEMMERSREIQERSEEAQKAAQKTSEEMKKQLEEMQRQQQR
jgi:Sec-independent protein translocase protein TatA